MKAYRVRGTFVMGRGRQPFHKEVAAADEAVARDTILSLLGSRHGTNRRNIRIDEVVELKTEDITDESVRLRVGGRR